MSKSVGTTDGADWYRQFRKYPWEDPLEYAVRSPLHYVANVKTPTMVMTGEADLRTPIGQSEADNPVIRDWGKKPALDFKPKEHFEVGEALGLLDFERAAKLAGTRFYVERGPLARLERALASFMLDLQTGEHGYTEFVLPLMASRATLTATGQLPKFEADLFKVPYTENVDYFLIPTAEVPLVNLHRETLDVSQLPLKYTAHTPCFRSEAGSYGKDTKGLNLRGFFTAYLTLFPTLVKP